MKWILDKFKKKPAPTKSLPSADVMREALDRLNDAVKHSKDCIHAKRVARIYDHEHDEVMCLDCGLIRLLDRHSTNKYSKKSEIPEVLKNWQEADKKDKE